MRHHAPNVPDFRPANALAPIGKCPRTGHIKWFTRAAAKLFGRRLKRDSGGRPFRVLHCPHCEAWHAAKRAIVSVGVGT
jgi:hypothetical protein